jgi:hypothetical protein
VLVSLKIVATFGLLRVRDLGSVEKRGSNRISTDFFGVAAFGRVVDFNADFFTDKFSWDFRGRVVDDDDKLRSFGFQWLRSLHVQCIILRWQPSPVVPPHACRK